MAGASAARVVAMDVLGEVRRRDAYARDILRSSKAMDRLTVRDRALASRLDLGVVGTSGYLDATINAYLSQGTKLEPRVRDALRIATFELLFMRTPEHVAVSQGVELVRRARPRAARMANAVLRRIAKEERAYRADALKRVEAGGCDDADLARVSGYPQWLLALIAKERGSQISRSFAISALEAAPIFVAANEVRMNARELYEELDRAGLCPKECGLEGVWKLESAAGLVRTGLVESCKALVADLSAQQIVRALPVEPGMRILEVGQGRGTKTLLMQNAARRRGGNAHIVGVDATDYKVRVSQERMRTAGIDEWVSCACLDARLLANEDIELPELVRGSFDLVFVDAPCSGSGTLRRHPEIAWSLRAADVDASRPQSLPALQEALLRAAAKRVREGGQLCYATCSVLREEDESVVESFLASREGQDFTLASKPFLTSVEPKAQDGHFCAQLVRVARG